MTPCFRRISFLPGNQWESMGWTRPNAPFCVGIGVIYWHSYALVSWGGHPGARWWVLNVQRKVVWVWAVPLAALVLGGRMSLPECSVVRVVMTIYVSGGTKRSRDVRNWSTSTLGRSTAGIEKTHVLDLVASLCGLCTAAASSSVEVQGVSRWRASLTTPQWGRESHCANDSTSVQAHLEREARTLGDLQRPDTLTVERDRGLH